MEIKSSIIVCKNIEMLKSHILQNYSSFNLKMFKSFSEDDKDEEKEDEKRERKSEEFLIEDAKNVIKEAYISENSTKVIATIFKSYRVEAQNSLLKILEEPPKNIVFIIGVLSKSVLLPTIRSRMMIKNIKTEERVESLGINFEKLDIKTIYEFLDNKKFLDKNRTKMVLQNILVEALSQNIKLNTKEMQIFEKMLYLAELNSKSSYILLTALLTILNRKSR